MNAEERRKAVDEIAAFLKQLADHLYQAGHERPDKLQAASSAARKFRGSLVPLLRELAGID